MSDGFFFLPWFQIKVDAPIMIFAKFRVERRDQFPHGFAVPGHQFRKEKRGNRGVALGQVQAGADAAAFFAANQNVLFEHQFEIVLEADVLYMWFRSNFMILYVAEFGYHKYVLV